MGSKSLLKKLSGFFDMDEKARVKKRAELKDLLSRLKSKEAELQQKLEIEKDPERSNELAKKIDLVHSQRKKGVEMLQQLKAEKTS